MNSCVHQNANFDFVLNLTGDSPSKPQNQKHCKSINAFVEEFAKLKEVEDLILNGNDVFGVNGAFNDVLDKIEDEAKNYEKFQQYNSEEIRNTKNGFDKR
ncbi:vacuolar sorting protein, putative [Ichthyophthirius multifiliis]|uniref:Vacuolar sorting protein, putative n=1 Tax=Ichthyophthirius multifiliis TaxID=5932 RepID=G0QNW4_ICHMU|nr:vacuolar sorting protein, putative [Ichthyophthirius multifiliis]EGR33092.1 vacuolar sorting protein, putative [Ichthyophthirius multifiliis]|eukprot:XP_004037078.1 vacuolar sorting protein, putative [Ichthyophthirius multifiliis]